VNHTEKVGDSYNNNLYNHGNSRHAFTLSGNKKIGMGTNPSSASMMNLVSYDYPPPIAPNVRKIYLNGISIEILNQYQNGNIQVQIRFDDVNITNDVRWCADEIVLNPITTKSGYSINLKSGNTITLDQGLTATRMSNPITFEGKQVFTSPTYFRAKHDAVINIESNSEFIVKNGSTLKLETGSKIIVNNNSELVIKEGSHLIVDECASLWILGVGKLIVENGASLCLSPEASFFFSNGFQNIEIATGVIITPGTVHPADIIFPYLTISTNVTINSAQYAMPEVLTIGKGGVLTLNNTALRFATKQSKIQIKDGGELIIDNSILSSTCQTPWQGIEVWGEKNKSQIPLPGQPNAQGKVILKNGAVIENAENAITLWKKNDYSSTGGIVQADDAVFINNRRSVEFMSYQNTHPISETPLGNISYFKNCRFEVNDEYLAPAPFFAHISMWEVDGINIQACDFINNMSNEPNTGVGILTSNANFDILPSCSSLVTPCPENNIVPNTFQGFKYGIESFGTGANIKTICIKNAEFNGNSCGIKLRNVNNATIINSIFNVGGTTMYNAECGFNYGVGMELFNCTGFAIEGNSFYKVYGNPEGYFVGTYIEETQAADQIYKNEYYGLTYGNYAVGKNWKENNTYQGLAYYCNQNTWNWQDITVAKNVANPMEGGIQSQIGSSSLPAGNTFSNFADYHIYNDGDHLIDYFYYAPSPGNTSTSYYPARVYRVIREEVVGIQNQCLSNYGGGGSSSERDVVLTHAQKQQEEMDYATGLLSYDNVKALYDNLKDGGNTTGTLAEISSAWPSDMWQLRADLLGKSPHLSMEVLKATADKTDVLPESIIFEILAENPDELKKDELINYLEDKQNPLPEYMVDILRQVAMGSSYKTVLQRQMAHYNQVKTRAAHNIIRSLLNDTICNNNELRKWFDNIGGKRADEQIITTYMSEGNFTSALSLANMMPSLYNYNDNEMDEHYYYMQMLNLQINLAQQQRTIFDLDSIEIDNLLNIADNSIGTAGAQAKGILEFAYGYNFYNCIDPEEQGMKSRKYLNTAATENIFGIEITAKPNPANAWVAFDYTLPANDPQGVIKISNLSGNEIASIPVSGKQGQQIWDTRSVKPGVYFYTLNTAGLSRHGKIVISK